MDCDISYSATKVKQWIKTKKTIKNEILKTYELYSCDIDLIGTQFLF